MSLDMNLVVFGGRLVDDPKDLGGKGCKFEVASNRSYKDDDGEVKRVTTFMPVFCWGKLGSVVLKSCKKGDSVIVEGELEDRRFVGDDGAKKKIIGIRAKDVRFGFANKNDGKEESADETMRPKTFSDGVPSEARSAISKLLKGEG
jgi:single-strand DNA-binding protein